MSSLSPVLRAFVRDDRDMTGHVAYALYKRDKSNLQEAFAATHGRPIERRELDVFVQGALLDSRVSGYRSEAEVALQSFADDVIAQLVEDERAKIQAQFTIDLQRAKSTWRAIGENLVANLLAIGVVALLALVLYGTKIGFAQLLGDALGYDVRDKPPPPPAFAASGTRR